MRRDLPASVATTADGQGSRSSSFARILCASGVLRRILHSTRGQRSLTTSFRTEVIRSSSGTDRIGNPCVRDAMIRRLGMKTRHRRIIIDSRGNSCGGGGGQNLYEPWPQGPPPPLLLIFANFIGRGCRAGRWSAKCTCRMRPARKRFPLRNRRKSGNNADARPRNAHRARRLKRQ
jgi:hypothetical protein